MKQVDVLIIGGGSAGLSAALQMKEKGINRLLILERNKELGGILQQCIHNGFGLQTFHEELSGPMYAQRFIDQCMEKKIPYQLQSDVLSIDKNGIVEYASPIDGFQSIQAKTIVLACGCYERTRGAIQIPGQRLPGVYTAGSAQRFLNLENILVGKRIFILGSGDIGLIMARRMTLEGAKVLGVAEIMPYSNGLNRNIVQCLKDFSIPLYLSHTVVDIRGKDHVEQVVIAKVDEKRRIIPNTEQVFDVDTLLLSIGLIPEMSLVQTIDMELDPRTKGASINEYYQTSIPHIYACGNALHVHDVVDFVTLEAKEMATCVVQDLKHEIDKHEEIQTEAGHGVSYVLPQRISAKPKKDITFCLRVTKPYRNAKIVLLSDNEIIKELPKPYLLPSEMVRIYIKKEKLQELAGTLKIEVFENEKRI